MKYACNIAIYAIVINLFMACNLVAMELVENAGNKQDQERAAIIYCGIVYANNNPIVSLSDAATKTSVWLRRGENFNNYQLLDVTPEAIVLFDLSTKTKSVIALSGLAKEGASLGRDGADTPVRYSKKWINSEHNPMLMSPSQLPIDILVNWADLTHAEKMIVIEYYEKHGWILKGSETVGKSSTFVWENAYEKERSSIMINNRKSFEASLDGKQLEVWKSLSGGPIRRQGAGLSAQERKAAADNYKRKLDDLFSSLSKEQGKLLQGMNDFTKADWNN